MKEIMEILNNLDWSPLFISIKTGIVATVISFFLGIYAARKVIKAKPWVKAIADGILTLPMVLPPTVVGFSFFCYSAEEDRWEFFCMRHLILKLYRLGLDVLLQQQ